MKKATLVKAFAILITVYVGCYVAVRTSRTVVDEREGSPIRGWTYVYFPEGIVSDVFRPMIFLDKLTMNDTDFLKPGD